MEVTCSTKVFVPIYQTTWRGIPEVSCFEYILISSCLLKNNFAQQSHSKTNIPVHCAGFILFLQRMNRWSCYIIGNIYFILCYWHLLIGWSVKLTAPSAAKFPSGLFSLRIIMSTYAQAFLYYTAPVCWPWIRKLVIAPHQCSLEAIFQYMHILQHCCKTYHMTTTTRLIYWVIACNV
jgi:hypothetical protein